MQSITLHGLLDLHVPIELTRPSSSQMSKADPNDPVDAVDPADVWRVRAEQIFFCLAGEKEKLARKKQKQKMVQLLQTNLVIVLHLLKNTFE